MKNLKLVIFDMDGLMFNTERTYLKAIEEYAYRQKWEVDLQPLIDVMGSSIRPEIEKMILTPGVTLEEFGEKVMHASHDGALEEMCSYGVPIKKGLFHLMDKCDAVGVMMCVATSTEIERSGRLLEAAGVMDRLEFVITRKEVEHGKPEPDIFLKACEWAKVKPEEALVLEDSNVGARAALNGNIPYIMVPDLKEPEDDIRENSVKICKDLDEVCDLI